MQGQSIDSQARAAERLFVAVVNQAILDVLEHGEEAEDAERWLLSKDFDALQILFHEWCGFMPSFTPPRVPSRFWTGESETPWAHLGS